MLTLQDITRQYRDFYEELNLTQFHHPKNLACQITIEAMTLLDATHRSSGIASLWQPMASLLAYTLLLADRLKLNHHIYLSPPQSNQFDAQSHALQVLTSCSKLQQVFVWRPVRETMPPEIKVQVSLLIDEVLMQLAQMAGDLKINLLHAACDSLMLKLNPIDAPKRPATFSQPQA